MERLNDISLEHKDTIDFSNSYTKLYDEILDGNQDSERLDTDPVFDYSVLSTVHRDKLKQLREYARSIDSLS